MILSSHQHWSRIINLIIRRYLYDTTLCILWNNAIEFNLENQSNIASSSYYAIISMNRIELSKSLESNVVDFLAKRQQMINNGVIFDDLVEKLTISIEKSHCESFLAFQSDIPIFVEAFINASTYSIWRSIRNKFIFVYYNTSDSDISNYFKHIFFEDQPSILLIEASHQEPANFNLKTNKYVGSRAEQPGSIYLLDRYNALNETFEIDANLFPDKTKNLQGREVIVATFDYRPYTVIEYTTNANSRDLRYEDPIEGAVHIEGTETTIFSSLCQKYNCTLQLDTSENDWGVVYQNISGDGALGMIPKRKAEVAVGAMYFWYVDYVYLDMSTYIVRTGITCLVPAPSRLASFLLPLQPFQSTLWAAVIAYLIIEIISLVIVHQFDRTATANGNNKKEITWYQSFKYGFVITFKLFISQTENTNATTIALRTLLLFCFMNDIIITSIYSGGLASILTIPSFEEAANSMERLRKHNLKWAANSEAWVLAIRNTGDPLLEDLLRNFDIYTDEKLVQLAASQKMGFTVERLQFGHFAVGDHITQDNVAHMKLMMDDIYFQYTAAFVSRLWPLLERLDNLIYIWHSSGLDKYWEWRTVADNLNGQLQKEIEASLSSNLDNMGPVPLGISNFIGILLVWVLGILIAIIIFLCELFIKQLNIF